MTTFMKTLEPWLSQSNGVIVLELLAAAATLFILLSIVRWARRRRSSSFFDLGAVSTTWLQEIRQATPYDGGRLDR